MINRAWIPALVLVVPVLSPLAAGPAAAEGQCHGAAGAVHAYVLAVHEGRGDAARTHWSATYLDFADRHGVVPRTTPFWWDVASPVVRYRDELAAGRAACEVAARPDHEGAVATVTLTAGTHTESFTYTVVHEDGDWRLSGRLWGASRRWPVLETRYFRIRHPAGHLVDPGACDLLDAFVDDVARKLGGDTGALVATPMPYLAADAATVEEITGHATVGMVDVASGTVVSSHFPHFHEVTHLLVGRFRPEWPAYHLPVFQEGLACLLGGRWGRSPEVVLHQGWIHLDWGTVAPSGLLAADDFGRAPGGPDATYGVAALVCDLILAEAGWHGLVDLYGEFTGQAAAASAAEVAAAVARVCGLRTTDPAAALDEAVAVRARRCRRCGVAPDTRTPFAGEGIDTSDPSLWRVRVGGGGEPVILIWGESAGDPATRSSTVFGEQVPDRIWLGRRWGLVCRPEGVSFYDFTANRLAAVWAAGFTGEEPLDGQDLRFVLEAPPAGPVEGLVVFRPGEAR